MSDVEARKRIIEKAREYFLGFGFSKVTMNEIATELGMSKKTLYAHFESKEELLAAIVQNIHQETADFIDTLIADTGMDFTEKLFAVMNTSAKFHNTMSPHFLIDLKRNAPEICNGINCFMHERVEMVMHRLLKEGIEKNVFRKDINPQLLVMMYQGAFQSLVRPDVLAELPFTANQVIHTIGEIFFGGILTEEARLKIEAMREHAVVHAA